jgi:hypothetical protein
MTRSVYDKLSNARELEIKADVGNPRNGKAFGFLFFYDRSQVPEQSLKSTDFLCREGNRLIASWMFQLKNGKWTAATPPFDYATDTLCSESD